MGKSCDEEGMGNNKSEFGQHVIATIYSPRADTGNSCDKGNGRGTSLGNGDELDGSIVDERCDNDKRKNQPAPENRKEVGAS